MAVDIGLHRVLKSNIATLRDSQDDEETQNEEKARNHAFWGCFHVDQYVGHIDLPDLTDLTLD